MDDADRISSTGKLDLLPAGGLLSAAVTVKCKYLMSMSVMDM